LVNTLGKSEVVRPPIYALTGVRFLAAFCVLLNHLLLGYVSRDVPHLSAFLASCGSLGMTMFFVLSGFIVHYNYSDSLIGSGWPGLRRFFVARIARLYPLYVAVVVIDIFLVLYLKQIAVAPVVASLPFYATATHGWFYFIFPIGASLSLLLPRASITWSISTEFFLYILYPGILCGLRLVGRQLRSTRYVPVLVAVASVLYTAYFLGFLKKHTGSFDSFGEAVFGHQSVRGVAGSYSFSWWALFVSPYFRVFEFLCGVIVAEAYLRTQGIYFRRLVGVLGGVSLLYLVAAAFPEANWYSPIRRMNAHVGYLPFCAAFVAWMAWGGGLLAKLLGSAPFRFLGDRSYSFYLIHIFVYAFGVRLISQQWGWAARIAVTWITLLAIVCVTYRYVEVPARRFIRNRFS
jgi:peptidoglycan/LPS O-acetylase OafA/YrhL